MTYTIPPHCNGCGSPGTRHVTRADNQNGNAGRPYWLCSHYSCPRWSGKGNEWKCWDDDLGIAKDNPGCYCGEPSRLGLKGVKTGEKGVCFWSCSTGNCDYYSEDIRGATWRELDITRVELHRFCDGGPEPFSVKAPRILTWRRDL